MKLVYFTPVGTIGGAEMCLLDLLASTGRSRPDWRLTVILGDDGPLVKAVEALGARRVVARMPGGLASLGDSGGGGLDLLARMARSSASCLFYMAKLARLFRRERPDLIQTNGMKAHLLAPWVAPRNVPIVWHLHDYLGPRPFMGRQLRAARRPNVSAVAVSRSVLNDARKVLGSEISIRAIHNAVDVDRFAPGPGDGPGLDRSAGWPEAPDGTVRVGLVATFARWKGHEVFFEAISRIEADRPARFYVVGGPIYRSLGSQWSMDELKAEAKRRGVLDRVGFVGPVDDPASALRALDVVVHASTRPEPFGRAIVEGMATARPVVAILDGGAAELFVHGESALGCPPNDPAALARAIDRLIIDPPLRRSLGMAGRSAVLEQFDANRLFEAWAPVYSDAVKSGEGRPDVPLISSRVLRGRASDTEVSNAHGR